MAAIVDIGRAGKVTDGKGAVTSFRIAFPSDYVGNISNGLYFNGIPITIGGNDNNPTTGTLVIAGIPVTLVAADIVTPAAVATKIETTGIAGYTVKAINDTVTLTSTTLNVGVRTTLVLGTAKNILFDAIKFEQGAAFTSGAQDDIWVRGKTPFSIKVLYTGGTSPTVAGSYGSIEEQRLGTLTYEANFTLSSGFVSVTTPYNWIKMTTQGTNTTATIYIDR
jgi:hypothetical protein